jgi:hypothetical protein
MPRLVRTEAIYKLRDLIHLKITDGSRKLPVYVNEGQPSGQNAIHLFYTEDNDWVSEITKKAPYYRHQIQVSIRHNDYNKARSTAFTALEYINANRKTLTGLYFMPDTTPIYAGQDAGNEGYWFTFNINSKGAK